MSVDVLIKTVRRKTSVVTTPTSDDEISGLSVTVSSVIVSAENQTPVIDELVSSEELREMSVSVLIEKEIAISDKLVEIDGDEFSYCESWLRDVIVVIDGEELIPSAGHVWIVDINRLLFKTADGMYLSAKES